VPDLARQITSLLVTPGSGPVANERFRALGSVSLSPAEIRAKENVSIIQYLVRFNEDPTAMESLVRILTGTSDDQLFFIMSDVLNLLPGLLLGRDNSLSGFALRALATIAGSPLIKKDSKFMNAILALFPLVIPTLFGPDHDFASQAVIAICRTIGIPPLAVSVDLEQCISSNVPILVKFVSDLGSFVDQLAKLKDNSNPQIRSAVCLLLAGLMRSASAELRAKRDEISVVVASFMNSRIEEVRLAAAHAFGLLVS
jgi:hypothetical protein